MITRDQIVWLYRCFLNREPESEDIIEQGMQIHPNFESARISFIMAREFRDVWLPAPTYIPSRSGRQSVLERKHKLAIAAIVKDEEHIVSRMIESCIPIADFFSIVDTGSSDGTLEVVKSVLAGHGISNFVQSAPFTDFSTSRNLSLKAVPDDCDWILVLDADEHLVEEDLPDLLKLLEGDNDGWSLPRFNFVDIDKVERPTPYPDLQMRLFRNNLLAPVRYSGAVHERPIDAGRWCIAPVSMTHHGGPKGGPHIHHMGRAILTPEKEKKRQALYRDLSQ